MAARTGREFWRRVGIAAVATGLVMAVSGIAVQQAGADHDDPPGWVDGGYPSGYDGPVRICHATNSNANPYIVHTPNASGVEGNTNHFEHTGPVWDPTLKKLKTTWGDIIPPVPPAHGGLNWDDGQAIWHNGCQPVTTPTIGITKTPVNASVQPGAVIAYDIVVTAGGTATSENVEVSDQLDTRYTWLANNDDCSINGTNLMTCAVGDLEPAETFIVRVSATTAPGVCTTVDNAASVEADEQGGETDDTDNVITVNDGKNCESSGCVVNCGPPPPPPPPPPPAPAECVPTAENNQCTPCPDEAPIPDGTGFCDEEDLIVPADGSPPATVGGVVVSQPAPQALPRTGSEAVALLQIGLGLIVMGAGAMLFGRDRLVLI